MKGLQTTRLTRPARPSSLGLLGALLLGLASGCAAPLLPTFKRAAVVAPAQAALGQPLWGQGAVQGGEEQDRDRIWIVFDRALDPTTVHASRFAVVFEDGSRAQPNTAYFAAADEFGELRSVALEGEFRGPAGDWRVEQVQIYGPLFTADGAKLDGLDVAVHPPGAPRLVSAEWVLMNSEAPGEDPSDAGEATPWASDTCATRWALRTWWSDEILPAPGIGVQDFRWIAKGAEVRSPAALADLAPAETSQLHRAKPDNVLDLCFDHAASGRLEIEAKGLRGFGGAAIGASSFEVAAPAASRSALQ